MKKQNQAIWMLTLVCVILGFFSVHAFDKTQSKEEIINIASLQNIEELLNQKKALDKKKQELDHIITQQESKIKEYENNAAPTLRRYSSSLS
jgi:uncharacterized protein HemX